MADLFKGGLTAFDIVVLAVIVVSAVMSLGRGLVREAFSVISFVIGFMVALLCIRFFHDPLASILPQTWPSIVPYAILFVVGFLLAYMAAAFVGGRLSKLVHANPEIGLLDRLAGAGFGILRGVLALVLFVLLMEQVLPEESTPRFVADSRVFPYADAAAGWVRVNVPGLVERAQKTIESPAQKHSGAAPK